MSSYPRMVNTRHFARSLVFAALLCALSLALVPRARGQFTLTSPAGFKPSSSVGPGSSAIANLSLLPVGGFTGTVALTCTVTTNDNQVTANLPTCQVSPASVTLGVNGAEPSLTVTTCGGASGSCTGATPPVLYSIAVTATSGANTATITLSLNVVNITESYTLSILPTTATPSPITAGQSATATVTVSPIGSYSGNVTLACLSITPVVTATPYCSFQYLNGLSYAVVTGQTSTTATLTITTLGPIPTVTKLWMPRIFYATWLAVPGLALVGIGGAGRRRKKVMGLLLLLMVASGLLFTPACGSNNKTNNPSGLVTPNNTYVFTLTGADASGASPGNSTTSEATVTLQVN